METNYWNELYLEVVFVAAGRQNRGRMWKQSPAKHFLIASSIGWAMFPKLTLTNTD